MEKERETHIDPMTDEPTLTIGQLAKAAGVNIETIRYYQRKGLLTVPDRPANGYRRYPDSAARRIAFIKRAQGVGFSLKEIGLLLSLGTGHCCEVQALASRKLLEMEARLRSLQQMRNQLRILTEQCNESMNEEQRCALLESLLQQHAEP